MGSFTSLIALTSISPYLKISLVSILIVIITITIIIIITEKMKFDMILGIVELGLFAPLILLMIFPLIASFNQKESFNFFYVLLCFLGHVSLRHHYVIIT